MSKHLKFSAHIPSTPMPKESERRGRTDSATKMQRLALERLDRVLGVGNVGQGEHRAEPEDVRLLDACQEVVEDPGVGDAFGEGFL